MSVCVVDGCDEPRFVTRTGRPYGARCRYHFYAGSRGVVVRPSWEPDELTMAVDARHAACVAAGGCEYGEVVVVRPSRAGNGYFELRVCARCGVPEPPPILSGARRNVGGSPFAGGVVDEDG